MPFQVMEINACCCSVSFLLHPVLLVSYIYDVFLKKLLVSCLQKQGLIWGKVQLIKKWLKRLGSVFLSIS